MANMVSFCKKKDANKVSDHKCWLWNDRARVLYFILGIISALFAIFFLFHLFLSETFGVHFSERSFEFEYLMGAGSVVVFSLAYIFFCSSSGTFVKLRLLQFLKDKKEVPHPYLDLMKRL